MGWPFDEIAEAVGGAVDVVVDTVVDTFVEPIQDTVETVVNTVSDVAEGDFGGAIGGLWGAVESAAGGFVDTVGGGFFGGGFMDVVDLGLGAMDSTVFEAAGSFDIGIASGSVGISAEDGFESSGSAGIDWGPFPYVEGHVEISPTGEISVGGEAQATIPTPWGVVDGEVAGGYERNEDGSWGVHGSAEGTLYTPAGVVIGAGGHVEYAEEADGDVTFGAGAHGSVGYVGGPSVSAGAEYGYVEDDGTVTETFAGQVGAEAYGASAGMGGSVVNQTNADGTSSTTTDGWADAEIDGLDTGQLLELGGQALGIDTSSIPLGDAGSPMDMIGDLAGSGDLSEVISDFAGDAGSEALDTISSMANDGTFDDFTSDVVNTEVAEATLDQAADEMFDL